ncbi:MAG TPA: DUF3300 domain-containing protein [Nitrospirales bacterium]|nr:DUF3300 domain-containing protein [Nitrospiraceae bacterium]HNP27850.1 DUF3300 domain-containing protein [Nitrospirales bacterium]
METRKPTFPEIWSAGDSRSVTPLVVSLFLFHLFAGFPGVGLAQEGPSSLEESSGIEAQKYTTATQNAPTFSQKELDQMLAPIALYPDSLLSQILIAATYPLEVVEAARWSKAHPTPKGEQAVQAAQELNWDPSVKSMLAFPQILMMMDEKLTWTQQLGDAVLSQQPAVMDTIQTLRQRALSSGNLTSNDKILVTQVEQNILIAQANPRMIYVPYYDPLVAYGPWWWTGYPPVYWPIWPGYIGFGFGGGFSWGLGIGVGPGFFFGGFNFARHQVLINRGGFRQPWRHSPEHRRSVPYRDNTVRQPHDLTGSASQIERQAQGFDGLRQGTDTQGSRAPGSERIQRPSNGPQNSRGGGGFGRSPGGGGGHGGPR